MYPLYPASFLAIPIRCGFSFCCCSGHSFCYDFFPCFDLSHCHVPPRWSVSLTVWVIVILIVAACHATVVILPLEWSTSYAVFIASILTTLVVSSVTAIPTYTIYFVCSLELMVSQILCSFWSWQWVCFLHGCLQCFHCVTFWLNLPDLCCFYSPPSQWWLDLLFGSSWSFQGSLALL